MKIYTKQGDAGKTKLLDGQWVSKDDLRLRTYGTFDELNAVLGLIRAEKNFPADLCQWILRIQTEIFQLSAELATPRGHLPQIVLLEELQITALENEIDWMDQKLKPLHVFILPGGALGSALLHFLQFQLVD